MADVEVKIPTTARGWREKRRSVFEEARNIGKDKNGDLSAEDRVKSDKMFEDMGEFSTKDRKATGMAARIEVLERNETFQREFDAPVEQIAADNVVRDDARLAELEKREARGKELRITRRDRDLAFRAWAAGGDEDVMPRGAMEAAKKIGLNPRRKSVKLSLRRKAPQNYAEARAASDPLQIASSESGSSGIKGGFTVQNEAMITELEIQLLAHGPVRTASQVIRTATGASLPWPTMNDSNNSGAIIAETIASTFLTMNFGQVVFGAFKYSSLMIPISVELLQDTILNMPAIIGEAAGVRIARIQNSHLTTGASSDSVPSGIVGGSTTRSSQLGVTSSTYAQLIFTELMALQHSVDAAYRVAPTVQWMFSDDTLLKMKQVTLQSSHVAPLWLPSVRVGSPDTILGRSYVVNSNMPNYESTGGAQTKPVAFGDFNKFIVRDALDIDLIRLDERYADQHMVGFVAIARMDAGSIQYGAIKHLITASSS